MRRTPIDNVLRRAFVPALLLLLGSTAVLAQDPRITSVAPGAASVDVTIRVTGTGFSATASANAVTFESVSGGAPLPGVVSSITAPDPAGLRRISVRVPAGLPIGPARVLVRNTETGLTTPAAPFNVVALSVGVPVVNPGQTLDVPVLIRGNAAFDGSSFRLTMGSGITVTRVVKRTATEAIATVTVAANAAVGPRTVTLLLSNATATGPDALRVDALQPGNRAPAAVIGGDTTGGTGQAVSFDASGSTDPDGDTLTYAWSFGDGTIATGQQVTKIYAEAGTFTVTLTVEDGRGGTGSASRTVTIEAGLANRPPEITSQPPTTGVAGRPYSYQLAATDPDSDPLTFELVTAPEGMTVSPAGVVTWTPGPSQIGSHAVAITVRDGRGGEASQPFSIAVSAPPTLQSIALAPAASTLTSAGAVQQLTVTGQYSDGSSSDLTPSSAGTTYESSASGVVTVGAEGAVTAVADGVATITARNGGFSATAQVTVAIPPSLTGLDVVPARATLRGIGATLALTLTGRYSDATQRVLTSSPDVTWESSQPAVASVSATGVVTSAAVGSAVVTARVGALAAGADLTVAIDPGTGFVRGEVFDDRTGLPLGGATVTLLVDGGADAPAPVAAVADASGRFLLPARPGEALVRITRTGFTGVDRRGVVPAGGALTLLDARLSRLDARSTALQAIFGGRAQDSSGIITLDVAPAGLGADASVTLTPVSNQGLAGRLPLGWSPVAGVDVATGGVRLEQPATLRLPNADGLAPGASVPVVVYDLVRRAWVASEPGRVSDDGHTIVAAIAAAGQFAALVADVPPFSPASPVPGEPLAGVDAIPFPTDLSATSQVVPRAAPPGEDAQAVGRLVLRSASAMPSGLVVQALVNERYDLLDQSRVVPSPFTQDLVVYVRPRLAGDSRLGTLLPITPSLPFTIQQLALGSVTLDVRASILDAPGDIVGSPGGTVTAPNGMSLEVPPGALETDTFIGLDAFPVAQLAVEVLDGTEILGAATLDLVGVSLAQPARLSLPRPAGLLDGVQVWVAQVFADPFGVRRLRLVAAGELSATRLSSRTTVNGIVLPGVTTQGVYVFVRTPADLGLVTGRIQRADGVTPQPAVLATADTAPFADVSGAAGRFVIAGRAGGDTRVAARDAASGDGASVTASVPSAASVVDVVLTLAVAAPSVVSTSPVAGAIGVPLDSTVTITFSEPIDPASVTADAARLQVAGLDVATSRVLSADRRRLIVRPDAPLAGNTLHTLVVGGPLRDDGGNGLQTFSPISFRTLDPTKPPQPLPGQITAELPDEDGQVLVTGSAGTSEGARPVTVTNPRTQETVTVLALEDGSFRARIAAVIGDRVSLTFRNATGGETTFTLVQFTDADGRTAIGRDGGTVTDSSGRVARVRPRALTAPGTFRFVAPDLPAFPAAGADYGYVDRFGLAIDAAQFNQLRSLSLTESQNRFAPVQAVDAPFALSASMVVPTDFLAGANLRFIAVATDASGARTTAEGATQVVGSNPQDGRVEVAVDGQFPAVALDLPRQAQPDLQVSISAVAPMARVDFDLPAPSIGSSPAAFFLVSPLAVGTQTGLLVLDQLQAVELGGTTLLRTRGGQLPGVTAGGDFAVVTVPAGVGLVTGRVTGPPAIVSVDGWPFVAVTTTANGRFVLPVRASASLRLRFLEPGTFVERGTADVQSPAAGGTSDLGTPLGVPSATLTVRATPDAQSLVDIGDPIVFTFSEPVDPSITSTASVVVTDAAGRRVFGSVARSGDGSVVTFTPTRRWKYATRYRYGVAPNVRALSGATLAQPLSGEFTTFAPRLITSAPVGETRDVAVAGATVAAVGGAGLAVVDASSPAAPVVQARLPMTGGARGVAISSAAFVDRAGTTRPGPIAVVAAGQASGTGRAEVVSLANPSAPAVIGQVQLTTAPGQPAPQGVAPAPGTPVSVVVTTDGRAVAAIEGVGVSSLRIADAVPGDAANPGRALGPRYPGEGVESFTQAAVAGDRILAVAPTGLTVLDAPTLARLGGVSIQNAPAGVAGLLASSADRDGSGEISSDETFDLAVVAGGSDGTLQFFRVPFPGDPELISVVRLDGPATSVTVDADERLAFVGLGDRGVAIVDLDGPASVQPIDLDRDGVDDRLLGRVDTPGTAGRVARSRSLAFAADGAAGLAVLQVQPPRTRFLSLRRDPIADRPRDDAEVADGGDVFTSDEAISISLDASVPPQGDLSLLIDEQPDGGGPKRLAFGDGSVRSALVDGLNSRTIVIRRDATTAGASVVLRVVSGASAVLAERRLRLVPAVLDGLTVQELRVGPEKVAIGAADLSARLSVAALLADGRLVNVTADPATRFVVEQPLVAEVIQGAVLPRAGGTTRVYVRFGALLAEALIVVDRLPAVAAFAKPTPYLTLAGAGQRLPLNLSAVLTSGRTEDAAAFATFSSSDPSVATVDAFGNVTSVGEGEARITARAGEVVFDVMVAVEPRTPPALTGFTLEAPQEVTTDGGVAEVRGTISGTGSLEGLPVRYEVVGPGTLAIATSGYGGGVVGVLRGLSAPGTFQVRARVTNPATGTPIEATTTLIVRRGGSDAEPNDSPANATPVRPNARVGGTLGGGDARDVYQTSSTVPGALDIVLTLAAGTDPSAVRVIVFDAAGTEVARFTPALSRQKFSVPAQAGRAFVGVESTGPSVTYAVETRTVQGPLAITSVDPLAGGPGTAVTIQGTGFSTDPAQTFVYFGGAMGKVLGATPTRLDVLVPAQAIDGPVRVVSLARDVVGPRFAAGTTSRPPITMPRPNRAALRLDPISGIVLDPTRLTIVADAVVTRAQIEALVAPLGGTIVGATPAVNAYLVSFAANRSVSGIAAIQRQLAASPLVRRTAKETYAEVAALTNDTRDKAGTWAGTNVPRSDPYAQVSLFGALEAVRNTPDFAAAANLSPVKIAVVDSGFDPQVVTDFQANGQSTVQLFQVGPSGAWTPGLPFADLNGHGTSVTGIIGARNDGGFMSGVFAGLFRPDEIPPTIDVYSLDGGNFPTSLVAGALLQAGAAGDVDVVNLSLRHAHVAATDAYYEDRAQYLDALAPFAGRTLVVAAAGNEGVDSSYMVPGSLAAELPYVMSIGATATNNLDGSGESFDQRAVWGYTDATTGNIYSVGVSAGVPCNPGFAVTGSNCGPTLTLAAPGENILMSAATNAAGVPFAAANRSNGTSMATPIVAGIAAILQAIRAPGSAPLTPDVLRNLLVDSADDISAPWDAGNMRRLNALNAVRALLPPSGNQMIYVADQNAPSPGGGTGIIVGIDVDPFNGQPILPSHHVQIPLRFTKGGVQFEGTRPTSLAMAPAGQKLYAVVRSVQPQLGDGVLVVNTLSNEAEDFIPLSGAMFPAPTGGGGPPFAPVSVDSLRPGMVVTRDGRLMYVAAGLDIVIVNLAEGKIVKTFADLPAAYKAKADDYPPGALASALALVRQAAASGVAGRPGVAFTGLALSPDGNRLYAAVTTGAGGGTQPGGVLEILVGLYDDSDPGTPGLQPDLDFYLAAPATVSPLVNAGGPLGGDEPGGIAASGDGQNGGKYAYVVNGGLNFFEAIPPDALDLQKYALLLMGPAFVSSVGAIGGLPGMAASLGAFLTVQSALYDQLLLDIKTQANSGVMFIGAPGVTGIIDMAANRTNVWSFTSDVGFGWNPTSANGGAIVNQFRFQDVFAKRPFDITMRRDGRRAIVPFFQTGNFGVLDLDAQAGFLNPPASTPKPGFGSLPTNHFHGFVAVTPSLLLDNHLWPRRGAWTAGGTTHVPGPDENFLYAWDAEYAQNGYFAVSSHVGTGTPRVVSAPLPDFVRNLATRFSLERLGATFTGESVTWEEDGVTITGSVGTVVDLQRGGGGLSIISDGAITDELNAHVGEPVTGENATQRPYLATRPIQGAVQRLVKYRPGGADAYLHRPRGVAIQAFVGIEIPRFGDHVTDRQPVQVVWRDARVDQLRLLLQDPATVDESGESTAISDTLVPLTADQLDRRTASFVVGDLMPPGFQPQPGKAYRIEARVRFGENLLSRTHVDVVFDVSPVVPPPAITELRLTPRLNFFVAVPTPADQEKPLTLQRLDGNGVLAEDLSTSPDVTWRTLTSAVDPILETDVPGFGTFEQVIRDKLTENGLTIPFGKASVEVVNGRLRALTAGVQALQGCTGTGASRVCSNYLFVVAGLELDSLSLRPESVITGAIDAAEFAANNLTERFKDLDLNPPMILAADDTSIALDKGVILLQDVRLKFLGGPATLGLQDLYSAVGNVLESAGPLAFKELIAFELVKLAVGEVGAQFLTYECANTAVAGLVSDSIPFLLNKVQSGLPGVTQVTGTLNLEEIGLGKVTDDVLVWVLPQIQSAEIRENPTVIPVETEPMAGPSIRTFANISAITSATLYEVPGKYQSYAAFVASILPSSWLTWGTEGQEYVFDDGFKVSIAGQIGLDENAHAITLTNLRIGFDAPNAIVDYDLPGDTSLNPFADAENQLVKIAEPAVGTSAQVQHKNVTGATTVTAEVSLPALGSAVAQGTIAITGSEVELKPRVIFANDGDDCAVQLKVVALQGDGTQTDVSADPDTHYFSLQEAIQQGLTQVLGLPTSVAQAAIDAAAQKIRDKLAEAGVNVPFAHGRVAIDATGRLTVVENGAELVWATHKGKATRFSVVLAGFKLKSIDLQPLSLLTPPAESETGQAIIEKINEAFEAELEVNPPMVLVNSDPAVTGSFLSREGLVILRDIEFEVLGQATIKVRDMLGAVEDLVKPGLGAATLPQTLVVEAFFEVIELSLEVAGSQLLDFEMEDGEDVAEVRSEILETEEEFSIAPKGLVTAKAPGIAVVKGTLELDTPICNLGRAEDSVKVLVLPAFETLELKPRDTVISRQCTGVDPVAKVKSIVCTEPFASKTFEVPEGVQNAAEYVGNLLPAGFQPPIGGSITKDVTFSAGDFEFRLEGTVSASLSQVGFEGLRACFTVPNGIDGEPGVPPFVTNAYDFDDPAIAQLRSPPPRTTGFAAFVQGLQAGQTEIDNHFELITVSSLDAAGTVTVVDAQCQVTVDKGLLDPGPGATTDASGNPVIAPGDTVTYRVRVGNTGTAPLENLTINEVATLTGQPSLPQPIVSTCGAATQPGFNSCAIPRLEPNEILDFDVTVFVPPGTQNAQLCNTATVNAESAQVCHATAGTGITITKALVDPGSGVPDPAVDPSGAPVLVPGETVRYRVTVENAGTATETNISVDDVARLVDPRQVLPRAPLFTQTFTIASLAPGASQSVEFSVALPADCGGGSRIQNRASVAGSTATTLHFLDCEPDLRITKRLIDPPVADGVAIAGTTGTLKRIRYQIRVENAGTGWAQGVTVSDDLQLEDDNGALQSLNPPGPRLGCSLGDIAPGQFAECPDVFRFEFAFGADANGKTLVNTATEDSTGRQAVTRHPVLVPRLEITKEIVSPAPGANDGSVIPAGTTAVYKITVKNVSDFPIENIQLRDTPLVVNVQTGQVVFTPSNALFTFPRLDPDEEVEEGVTVAVPPGSVLGPLAGLRLFNRAEVTNVDGVDPAEVTSDIVAGDLRIEKRLVEPAGNGTQDLVRGSYAEYEVSVTNAGTGPASVTFTDVAYIPGEPVFPANGVPVPFTLGEVAPGQTVTQRVRMLVPHREEFTPTCPQGGLCAVTVPRLTNVATLNAANPPAWTVTNDVVNPRLRVTKVMVDPPPGPGNSPPLIVAGSTVTYRLTVENIGTVAARNVLLRDRARVGAASVLDATFALGTLEPGQSFVQPVRFTVPTDLPGTALFNEARVNYQQDGPAATEHQVIAPLLVLRKSIPTAGPGAITSPGHPPVLRAGDPVVYRLELSNRTASAISSLTITDQPALEVRAANGSVTSTPLAPVTVTVPVLNGGQSFTTNVTVTIPAGTNGQKLVNRASVNAVGVPAVTTEHAIVEGGPGGLLITEMVLDPRQDWSDSGPSSIAGDVPFDDRPGSGAVDSGDVWVEITSPTAGMSAWQVVLVDANDAEFGRPFGTTAAGERVKVLSGFGAPVLPVKRVEVRDDTGAVRQSIDVAALEASFADITGPENESLTWSVVGPPTPVIQQFLRRPATIGQFLPF
jgi:PKD repeat protein